MLHHYGNSHEHGAGTFFSLFFPLSGRSSTCNYDNNAYASPTNYDNVNYNAAAVDCTLSLATPSTRHAACSSSSTTTTTNNSARHFTISPAKEADANSARPSQRRCANCDTASTPLWRNGPRGPKSLCNACGIRYKKEERRAAAAAAVSPMQLDCTSGYISGYPYQQQQSWGCYASTVGNDTSESRDLAYMPWRLNIVQPQPFPVVDRTGLYQYN